MIQEACSKVSGSGATGTYPKTLNTAIGGMLLVLRKACRCTEKSIWRLKRAVEMLGWAARPIEGSMLSASPCVQTT